VTLDKSGKLWRGENFDDLAELIRDHQAGGYPVDTVTESICARCDGRAFRVLVDDLQGFAERMCVACETTAFLADSADYKDDDEFDPGECECPCGGGEFAVAVGFSLLDDGEVRWVSVGLRCLTDGTLGVYTDWKIDYTPSRHLLGQA
jgi:hypothetical protein